MSTPALANQRLVSLDVMRGLIMILLAGEACRVWDSIHELSPESFFGSYIMLQFFHHPWNGLRFWDLIQPAFMTMAGTAMYLSYLQKERKGISWEDNWKHILIRCLKLLIAGTALHCVYSGKLVWELWNVLTQLSVTTLIAYLIIRKSFAFQFAISIGLLMLTEILYRFVLIPGFDQPFVDQRNFGNFMDMVLMGKINKGGWVTINFIPTAAHTIWGVLIGKWLMEDKPSATKLKWLLLAGLGFLLVGFAMDWTGITPIIKRIATSSFTIASAGWVVLIVAGLFWWVDIKKRQRAVLVATVVGMNSIFIYLFFETVGHQWLNKTLAVFAGGFTGLLGAGEHWQALFTALAAWVFTWYLCYWLYQRKIFFKL